MNFEQSTVNIPQAIQIALDHFQAGRFEDAEAIFLRVLATDPVNFDALHLLGVLAYQAGRHETGLNLIQRALEQKQTSPLAYNNLGNALQGQGKLDEAVASYRNAISLMPNFGEAHCNLGNALHGQGKLDEAIASYRMALALNPNFAEAYCLLGNALQRQGKYKEAVASYAGAIALKANYADAHSFLGAALQSLGKLDDAVACYRKAIALKPDFAETHNNLGNALQEQGKLDESVASYREALSFKPDFAWAHNNLGNALKRQERLDEAVSSYYRALSIKPEYAEAHSNLGNALWDQGKTIEAIASLDNALFYGPDLAEVRWSIAMSKIPAVYGPGDSPSHCRAKFDIALAELDDWLCGQPAGIGFNAVGVRQPFYLAYQEENNRELLSRYGRLCCRVMNSWLQQQATEPAERISANVISLGIVSSHFCESSVWYALIKGWLQHLDRNRFQFHLFYLRSIEDHQTNFAKSNSTTFSQGLGGIREWVDTIRGKHLDVLIYPEIGMDPLTVKLASMRLAPIQISTWGHPETTGLPSIDYYLSAKGLEPDNADSNYTERLVELPHLGCWYPRMPVICRDPDLPTLGINPASLILICPGVPYKYAPQHDRLFVDIARELGKCQFVFFTHQKLENLSALLHLRLRSIFTHAGLRYDDYVISIPWQQKPAFYGLMKRADVYLDTIGFSGFNTAMQAAECGLPIVTREGRFLRGRLASGILKQMGLADLVAVSEDEYVKSAVKLARNADYKNHIRDRTAKSLHVLYEDLAPIRALEEFLTNVSKQHLI